MELESRNRIAPSRKNSRDRISALLESSALTTDAFMDVADENTEHDPLAGKSVEQCRRQLRFSTSRDRLPGVDFILSDREVLLALSAILFASLFIGVVIAWLQFNPCLEMNATIPENYSEWGTTMPP